MPLSSAEDDSLSLGPKQGNSHFMNTMTRLFSHILVLIRLFMSPSSTASIQTNDGPLLLYKRMTDQNSQTSRERKKHVKKTHIKNFRGEGVREGGFGARILYAGVIFPSEIQRMKNFNLIRGEVSGSGGGGLRSNF